MPRAPRPDLIERQMTRFLRQPVSVRNAARVIVVATLMVVIVTAAITSTFVARAQAMSDAAGQADDDRLDARLEDLADRLDRVERLLTRLAKH